MATDEVVEKRKKIGRRIGWSIIAATALAGGLTQAEQDYPALRSVATKPTNSALPPSRASPPRPALVHAALSCADSSTLESPRGYGRSMTGA
jgi:hypothetical protein